MFVFFCSCFCIVLCFRGSSKRTFFSLCFIECEVFLSRCACVAISLLLHAGAASTGFREGEPSFSAQVNLLESTAPSSSLARDLERMEKKRDLDAANLVNEASVLFLCD